MAELIESGYASLQILRTRDCVKLSQQEQVLKSLLTLLSLFLKAFQSMCHCVKGSKPLKQRVAQYHDFGQNLGLDLGVVVGVLGDFGHGGVFGSFGPFTVLNC